MLGEDDGWSGDAAMDVTEGGDDLEEEQPKAGQGTDTKHRSAGRAELCRDYACAVRRS